ncbi:aldo/keto reductase [Nocardioides marmoriginsengisoli]|uniref:Aldo/keto reductase n=1 Tax=Nocardioides marmoriginsengisoli TaxID=661483 RepID=A0A3N0CQV6_9ACTN|nr:aldo/keto reductase [Nocardioides marmoriginsengisoli]RNL65719.1 aldo/keto reductase [Nocardioides marmoriginsengisoli]
MDIPIYDLNDGTELPAVGFGTTGLQGADGLDALLSAVESGYRLIDTAVNYGNEMTVGEAIRRSGVPRPEFRVASKLPGRHHAYDDAIVSTHESIGRLGLDHIDLHMIHWPNPKRDEYSEAWRALVDLQRDGLVTTIGVSNFTAEHLDRIMDTSGVVPAVNQIEMHPYFPQDELRAVHDSLGIRTIAWSPLARAKGLFEEDAVRNAAEAHGVSPAQVVLRWHFQLGSVPIPKATAPDHQLTNGDIFEFELSDEQVDAITALGREDGRLFDGDPNEHYEM